MIESGSIVHGGVGVRGVSQKNERGEVCRPLSTAVLSGRMRSYKVGSIGEPLFFEARGAAVRAINSALIYLHVQCLMLDAHLFRRMYTRPRKMRLSRPTRADEPRNTYIGSFKWISQRIHWWVYSSFLKVESKLESWTRSSSISFLSRGRKCIAN